MALEKKGMAVTNKWCGQHIVIQRWVFYYEVVNPKNVWMPKKVVFGPKISVQVCSVKVLRC